MKTNIHLRSYLAQVFLKWEMFQTQVVEKIKASIVYSIFFFFRKSCRLWDMWKNIVVPDTPRTTIWRMRIACWINKAMNTLITRNNSCFPLQQWLHERASMLRYCTYIACLVSYNFNPSVLNVQTGSRTHPGPCRIGTREQNSKIFV